MRSNYKRIGDFIRLVKVRNTTLEAKELLGINIDKFFMPSVANIVGTDLSNYLIVKKDQFACNRMHVGRDYRIPVALSDRDEPFMVSPAYDVFEIVNTKVLLPEYLMMWFSRKEFDRNAWFYTDADVRGGLSWKSFCDMQLPVPPIEQQHDILKEYNSINNRIELNKQLIQKLEKTAQAIFKHWFVAFEFPNEEGRPYKSNGGAMVESEVGEIPDGWRNLKLKDLVTTQYGYTASAEFNNIGPKLLRITDIAQDQINWENVPHCYISQKEIVKYILEYGDIVIARTGATAGFAKRIHKRHPQSVFASYLVRMVCLDKRMNIYLGTIIDSVNYRSYILSNSEGSAQPQANATLMSDYKVLQPKMNVILKFNKYIEPTLDLIENYQIENNKLSKLSSFLLSKIATISSSQPKLIIA